MTNSQAPSAGRDERLGRNTALARNSTLQDLVFKSYLNTLSGPVVWEGVRPPPQTEVAVDNSVVEAHKVSHASSSHHHSRPQARPALSAAYALVTVRTAWMTMTVLVTKTPRRGGLLQFSVTLSINRRAAPTVFLRREYVRRLMGYSYVIIR
ncbi:hypothetical protein E2C01_011978 [Portunus trituberculatus]|uniref:Uncharacterized protein n=1 Tax=Portunus trituberculatus TaxID=210409 RepID=A0A5B7DCA9_PORTR|nr:hypothetical protein [Portunus trituberculatus]